MQRENPAFAPKVTMDDDNEFCKFFFGAKGKEKPPQRIRWQTKLTHKRKTACFVRQQEMLDEWRLILMGRGLALL